MGLLGKIKNILFEEEEIEVPVKEVKKAEKIVEEKAEFNQEDKLEKAKQVVEETQTLNLYDKEPTFSFPDFDEDEFESTVPKRKEVPVETRSSKLYSEHQREIKKEEEPIKKKEEPFKRNEVRSIGRGLSVYNDNASLKQEKKKFTPSPIISPVYGILDKDYHPDDISSREEGDIKRLSKLDVDTVRKKAFEPKASKEEKKEVAIEKKELEKETTKDELKKSVDELLADSAEEAAIIDENLNVENNIKEIEDELDRIDDELVLDDKPKEKDKDDTLEQDLFELIDSMYEDKKEDEE